VADGAHVAEDMRFVGVSGATLIRPQLERLRDRAALGLVDRLYVLSPDRLSRKYAHQALLMEELLACGVQVVFLNHAIGVTPEESLLLQMQGMIAEYERAKIMERNRRGKLHGAKRGSINVLSTAQDKTHIVHIHQGFDFLGWNFKKYVPKSSKRKAKLMIKPSKKNVSAFYRKVRDIIKNSGALTQNALMGRLNPVLRGWAQNHSPVVAKATFSKLDNLIFWRIFRWAKRRHPRKSVGWIKRRYYCSEIHRAFVHPLKGPDGMVRFRQLYMLADTAIVRHKRLPLAYQPYDAEQEFKWEALRVQRMLHKLRYRRQIHSLFRRQQGICALCGHAISKDTGWHDHHVVRRVDGGSDKLENRALLHLD